MSALVRKSKASIQVSLDFAVRNDSIDHQGKGIKKVVLVFFVRDVNIGRQERSFNSSEALTPFRFMRVGHWS